MRTWDQGFDACVYTYFRTTKQALRDKPELQAVLDKLKEEYPDRPAFAAQRFALEHLGASATKGRSEKD